MWFDGIRQPNTLYVLDSSRGKDSTAALRAIKILGWPLDAVVCADMWATKDIPAARPEMVAFQDAWDAKCKEIFNIPILKPYAKKKNGEKLTYEDLFYRPMKPKHERERERAGWAMRANQYCTGELKIAALRISNAERELVYIRPQTQCLTDFQYQARMAETGVPHSKQLPSTSAKTRRRK